MEIPVQAQPLLYRLENGLHAWVTFLIMPLFASAKPVTIAIASLPPGVRWAHIHGAGWLGGIGFTVPVLVATLAFREGAMLGWPSSAF